jgi:hypothetical protein
VNKGRWPGLLLKGLYHTLNAVKMLSYNATKKQEERSRMAAIKTARGSSKAAAAMQKRASLTGGTKSRITNFSQVAQAMAQWDK